MQLGHDKVAPKCPRLLLYSWKIVVLHDRPLRCFAAGLEGSLQCQVSTSMGLCILSKPWSYQNEKESLVPQELFHICRTGIQAGHTPPHQTHSFISSKKLNAAHLMPLCVLISPPAPFSPSTINTALQKDYQHSHIYISTRSI